MRRSACTVLLLSAVASTTACRTPGAVAETATLVMGHSAKLSEQLVAFERGYRRADQARAQRTAALGDAAAFDEELVEERRRVWLVGDDEVALRLFDGLAATRPEVATPDYRLPGGEARAPKPKALYDPKPIEEMIKKLQELVDGSDSARATLAFLAAVARGLQEDQSAAVASATDAGQSAEGELSKAMEMAPETRSKDVQ